MRLYLIFLCACIAVSYALEPFTAEHLHQIRRISAPTSNGQHVAFASRYWDQKSGVTTTNLRTIAIEGSTVTDLTKQLGVSDYSPYLHGDTVYFMSTRTGSSQLHRVPLNGGSVMQVTDLPVDIDNVVIDPNGDFILFSANIYIDCNDLQCTAERDQVLADIGENRLTVYSKLFIRHWDHYITPKKYTHIFYAKLSETIVEADVTDVMAQMEANSPVPPFGGTEQIAIAPNGVEFAITVEDASSSKQAWTTGWDIYTVRVADTLEPKLITAYTEARCQNPSYSPDSNLAYLAMSRPGYEADQLRFISYNNTTEVHTPIIFPNFKYSIDQITWVNDDWVILEANAEGYNRLFLANVDGTLEPTVIASTGTNSALSATGTPNEFVLTRAFWHAPNDVWLLKVNLEDPAATQLTKVTNENKELLDKVYMSRGQSFTFQSGGTDVQAWMWEPYDRQEKEYPVALLIHGGPQGAWTDGFSYRWNPQLWASRGYAVVAVNPCGSTGFGQDVTDCVNGDWGGKPFTEIIEGLDFITANTSWMASDNVCASGASYGGYMINWIAGHAPTRFKSFLNHDGVFDTFSMFFTTEELWFTEWEFGGTPMENVTLYNLWNPALHVDKWQTPMLVVQGGHDFRVPDGQGIGTFTALQRKGIDSKLLFYPTENHWVLTPYNGLQWYFEVLAWHDKYTNNEPPYEPSLPDRAQKPQVPVEPNPAKSKEWLAPTIIAVLLAVIVVCLIIYIFILRSAQYNRV